MTAECRPPDDTPDGTVCVLNWKIYLCLFNAVGSKKSPVPGKCTCSVRVNLPLGFPPPSR